MLVIHPEAVTAYQLPEDAKVAKEAFLDVFLDPMETWLRAYAFTMKQLVKEIIQGHEAGTKYHIYLDYSEEVGHSEHPEVEEVVKAGVETTIGTSPAGKGFIAHEKGWTTANGDCGEGSTNFSESAWEQVNTLLMFNDAEWRDMSVAAFNNAVQYAWTNERNLQLMAAPPSSFKA